MIDQMGTHDYSGAARDLLGKLGRAWLKEAAADEAYNSIID